MGHTHNHIQPLAAPHLYARCLTQGCILGKVHSAEANFLVQGLQSVLLGRKDLDTSHMRVAPVLVVRHDAQLQTVGLEKPPAWNDKGQSPISRAQAKFGLREWRPLRWLRDSVVACEGGGPCLP